MFQQMQAMAQKQVSHTQSPFSSFHIYIFLRAAETGGLLQKRKSTRSLLLSLSLSLSLNIYKYIYNVYFSFAANNALETMIS